MKENQPGLAAIKPLRHFARHADPERSVEFHVCVQNWLALISPNQATLPPTPGQFFSSFGLTVGSDRLQLDLFVPSDEIKRVAKEKGFFAN